MSIYISFLGNYLTLFNNNNIELSKHKKNIKIHLANNLGISIFYIV